MQKRGVGGEGMTHTVLHACWRAGVREHTVAYTVTHTQARPRYDVTRAGFSLAALWQCTRTTKRRATRGKGVVSGDRCASITSRPVSLALSLSLSLSLFLSLSPRLALRALKKRPRLYLRLSRGSLVFLSP